MPFLQLFFMLQCNLLCQMPASLHMAYGHDPVVLSFGVPMNMAEYNAFWWM